MNQANVFLIIFVLALVVLSLWWVFNTIRQIQLQKELAALPLINVVKLWHKAKYVPEDAKDRESLYLYQDFLSILDEDDYQYPIMVKNGGVRPMTRKEYDHLCHQKDKRPVSVLMCILSVVCAGLAIVFNTDNLLFGLGMAAIMPVLQVIFAIFINRFNRDKNFYREKLFLDLKENGTEFLLMTKPFIVRDAYPQKFGIDAKPKFVSLGNLQPEQITEVNDYVARQQAAETKVMVKSTRSLAEQRAAEQARIDAAVNQALAEQRAQAQAAMDAANAEHAKALAAAEQAAATATAQAQAAAAQAQAQAAKQAAAQAAAQPVTEPAAAAEPAEKELTPAEMQALLTKLLHDSIDAKKARQARRQQPQVVETQPAAPVEDTTPAPDPNDFSLDSIGIALDAELAKRRQKRA